MRSTTRKLLTTLIATCFASSVYIVAPKDGRIIQGSESFKARPVSGGAITARYQTSPLTGVRLLDENGDGNLEQACRYSMGTKGIMQICFEPDEEQYFDRKYYNIYQKQYSKLYKGVRKIIPSGGVEIYTGHL